MSDQLDECSICHEIIIDKVFMTCSSQHSFCFKCILQGIELTGELKSCPNCRGPEGIEKKFILLEKRYIINLDEDEQNFYSLNYFKKSLPVLQRLTNLSNNTCLLSEHVLSVYINNKKQLEFFYEVIKIGKQIDDIFNFIKWKYTHEHEYENGIEFEQQRYDRDGYRLRTPYESGLSPRPPRIPPPY